MQKPFGTLPNGEAAFIYTIARGNLEAQISDYGATLVRLYVPDRNGDRADVVLGFDDANGYRCSTTYFGATVGRNANRIKDAAFLLNGQCVRLEANENGNSLHSGPDSFAFRLWKVESHRQDRISFVLNSPNGDQGFPGNARIRVTYGFDTPNTLSIVYEGICDKDTVLNLTNHSYFNLAGHDKPELAMAQTLCLPARFFTPADAQSIPTGEKRPVANTPMDFRLPKPMGRDIDADYECLKLQGGYDHNFEVFCRPCAILCDPASGRTMVVSTDCPGLQVYSGNFLEGEQGKDGVCYCRRGGIALEPQYYPNSVNQPEWPQPFVKAGEQYRSVTEYTFE